MLERINFRKIVSDNLELAVSIQNEIFPEEDGRENFIECVEHNPYRKELDYYIVYDSDIPIGITGIYSYHEYPYDAWLGWFGVLSKYREKGYGNKILDMTINMARDKGYKNLRLYSDESFLDAHRLYKSKGMIQELYDNPDDKDPYEPEGLKTYIFSISLNDEKVDLWNNKILGLKEQGMKER